VLTRGFRTDPVFAGCYSLNGNGEMTGTIWVEESGYLESPVMITNTHSVGLVRDAVIDWLIQRNFLKPLPGGVFWSLPVVGETWDGFLNDINGFHVDKAVVFDALDSAKSGPVREGNVGGGTGMICHRFKGGIGTSSRIVDLDEGKYTLGVLVQANYGAREHLMIAGAPVGQEIADLLPIKKGLDREIMGGSIIVVVATDAPLLPHQLKRIARRVPLGIARVGGMGSDSSGDIFIAFSTANQESFQRGGVSHLEMLANSAMTPLFEATTFATEEAIINALLAAETMTGVQGNTVHALPHSRLVDVLKKYGRI
ncbi:MAG: P1 family peptidase, partial [Chloroflexota bacterium]